MSLSCSRQADDVATILSLQDGWHIAAAGEIEAAGPAISTPGFDVSSWTPTTVPTTVLAALTRSGEVKDPYFEKNLEKIPLERFQQPWWYRTEFTLEAPLPTAATLAFDGINYSADVWLNGQKIADRDEILGAFRLFELDVTPEGGKRSHAAGHLMVGANALAVAVHPPQPGDPSIGFVDWNPTPPDRNMGLWRGVELRLSGDVALDDVFVRTDVDLESLARASLTVQATLKNHASQPVTAAVTGTIGDDVEITQQIALEPGEERQVSFAPAQFEQLVIEQPRLWWPHTMGEPNLYELALRVDVGGLLSDRRQVTFGIRHVEDYLTEDGHRGYAVNGRKLLIRGGGWVDDLMLADDDRRLRDQTSAT